MGDERRPMNECSRAAGRTVGVAFVLWAVWSAPAAGQVDTTAIGCPLPGSGPAPAFPCAGTSAPQIGVVVRFFKASSDIPVTKEDVHGVVMLAITREQYSLDVVVGALSRLRDTDHLWIEVDLFPRWTHRLAAEYRVIGADGVLTSQCRQQRRGAAGPAALLGAEINNFVRDVVGCVRRLPEQ